MHKISKKNLALTHYMATSQAPLTGKYYGGAGQNQITVLTYDQQFLRETGSAWPIAYSQHADTILRLVEDESTRPKAIFLDITFTQKRDDPSVDQLVTGLCKAKTDFGVDVYLAALPSNEDGKLHVRTELDKGAEAGCFKLVSVNFRPDQVDRISWDYPLYSHMSSNGWNPTFPKNNEPILTSAALAIAKDGAGFSITKDDDSIALVWGVINNQPVDNPPDLFAYCRNGDKSMFRIVPGVIRGVLKGEDARPICPYNLTYSVSQLSTLPEAQLVDALKGRYVLIGAVVPGQNDLIDSPVHGTIPGIYLHAMALDNLLSYGASFKRSANWDFIPSFELITAGLSAILIVFVVHVLWLNIPSLICVFSENFPHVSLFWVVLNKYITRPTSMLKTKVFEWLNRQLPHQKLVDAIEVIKRFAHLIFGIANWLVRITLQTAITMLCVVFLQRVFSIGMLPVVELVGMTILAEMFDYASKIEKFTKISSDGRCAK